LKKRVNPVGRLDIAAVRLLEQVLKVKAPQLRAVLFDGGKQEQGLKLAAAKLLGPRTGRARLIRNVAPVLGAAFRDARGIR
jgi:hypothetical protein